MQKRNSLVLFNPLNGKFINQFDEFVDDESQARIFSSILEADGHSSWFEHVYGVQLYVKEIGK